jgi:hypothetical protein
MFIHLRGSEVQVPIVPPDEGHVGEFINRFSTDFESSDSLYEVGYWQFEGEMWTAAQDGYELVIAVLEGSATLRSAGEQYVLEAGDMLVQNCPLEEKTWSSSGVRAFWIRRWRTADHTAASTERES